MRASPVLLALLCKALRAPVPHLHTIITELHEPGLPAQGRRVHLFFQHLDVVPARRPQGQVQNQGAPLLAHGGCAHGNVHAGVFRLAAVWHVGVP